MCLSVSLSDMIYDGVIVINVVTVLVLKYVMVGYFIILILVGH